MDSAELGKLLHQPIPLDFKVKVVSKLLTVPYPLKRLLEHWLPTPNYFELTSIRLFFKKTYFSRFNRDMSCLLG